MWRFWISLYILEVQSLYHFIRIRLTFHQEQSGYSIDIKLFQFNGGLMSLLLYNCIKYSNSILLIKKTHGL